MARADALLDHSGAALVHLARGRACRAARLGRARPTRGHRRRGARGIRRSRPRAQDCALWDALTRRASPSSGSGTARRPAAIGTSSCCATPRALRDGGFAAAITRRCCTTCRRSSRCRRFTVRALRDDAFEKVRRLLKTGGNDSRFGLSEDERDRFLAIPSLVGDTLLFVPYPNDRIVAAEPGDRAPEAPVVGGRRPAPARDVP